MARISGVDLPREKRVEIGLTYIYGIGRAKSNEILTKAAVDPDIRCKDLSDEQVGKIRDVIEESVLVEGDLRREVAMNIKRLQEIGVTEVFVIEGTSCSWTEHKETTQRTKKKVQKKTIANKKK